MTPPDSGEREVQRWEALHDGHTVACEEAAHRRGHENVCICEAKESKILRRCAKAGCNLIASGVLAGEESPFCDKHTGERKSVLLPLPLAQRILAALEREAETSFHKRKLADLIDELRAVVEGKS